MPDGPSPLEKLLKGLEDFFLRLFYWIFSKTEPRGPDPEAQLDLPANIIYREKLPAWMSEPPKNSNTANSSQPLRHSDEWAQQKADFLRSPGMERKPDMSKTHDKKARTSGHCVHSSEFPVEYHRTPSDDCPQGPSHPPTIRIEDWSTHPSAGTSFVSTESLPVMATSYSRSNPESSSSRDSLTVPSQVSPSFFSPPKASRNRKTPVCGTLHKNSSSHSKGMLDKNPRRTSGANRNQTRRSSLPQPPNAWVHDFAPPGSIRPAWASKSLSKSSVLDLFETTFFSTNGVHRHATRGTLAEVQGCTNTRNSLQRRRTSCELHFTPPTHHSHPLSPTAMVPVWDDIGATKPYPSEMAEGYYRHSMDSTGLLFPMGVTLSSDVQAAMLARLPGNGLAATAKRSSSGCRRRLPYSHAGVERKSAIVSSSDLVDIPYPYVFDLDDYFQGLSPSSTPSESFHHNLTSEASSSSHNESQDSFDTPTPAPRNSASSSINLLISAHDLLPPASRNSGLVSRSAHNRKGKLLACKIATPVRKPATWSSSDTDEEEQSFSRSEYSDESDTPVTASGSNSSGDLPLAEWIVQRLENQSGPNKRKGIVITQRASTTSEPASTLVNTEHNSVSSVRPISKQAKTGFHARNNGPIEMEQIRANLRSHYVPTRRQPERDPLNEQNILEDIDENSVVSLVESYSSGSTFSHHYHSHQWKAKTLPSPRTERRNLGPVFEASSEPEHACGTCTPKAAPLPEFSGDDESIITANRTPPPPAWVLPPHRTGSVKAGLISSRLGLGSRNKQKPVNEKDRYRGAAFTKTSPPGPKVSVNEGSLQTQKLGFVGGGSKRAGVVGARLIGMAPTPSRSMGRRVMPQRF